MSSSANPHDEIDYLQRQLTTVRDEFKDFTYIVSHDLGAPLRAVVSFSKMLSEKYEGTLDEKGELYLKFVTRGGEKLQAMLSGLVDYSRVDTRKKPLEVVETAVLVGQCHAALKDKIIACKGSIRVQGTLPPVLADPDQCLQLFLAVIDNALTYHAPSIVPHVRILATDIGEQWKFSVEDNGIGIDPASQERVFLVFKRLHTDEEYPGVGMGLALAEKIVVRHGGAIGITPGAHGGTICWFTLPKALAGSMDIPSPHEASYG